ncbi:MAG: helix-turn-helix domain-containing protein [Candidatus Altiarchaeota archaeon]
MRNALLVLGILILLQFANSQTEQVERGIEKVSKIDIAIDENGVVNVKEELSLSESTAIILIPKTVENLLIYDSKGNPLGYELSAFEDSQLLRIYLKSQSEKDVRFSYSTQALTRKNASLWTINFYSLTTPGKTIIELSFPKNSNVTSFRTKEIVYLYPPNLKSPIFLYPQEEKARIEFDYRLIPEKEEMNIPSLITLIIFILVSISVIIYYKWKIKSPKKEIKAKENASETLIKSDVKTEIKEESEKKKKQVKLSILNMLDENEKRVVGMLQDFDIEITQAYIYKTLEIPKASLSNIIKRLESRNLIEKRKDGRINWIKLKDWVFD